MPDRLTILPARPQIGMAAQLTQSPLESVHLSQEQSPMKLTSCVLPVLWTGQEHTGKTVMLHQKHFWIIVSSPWAWTLLTLSPLSNTTTSFSGRTTMNSTRTSPPICFCSDSQTQLNICLNLEKALLIWMKTPRWMCKTTKSWEALNTRRKST